MIGPVYFAIERRPLADLRLSLVVCAGLVIALFTSDALGQTAIQSLESLAAAPAPASSGRAARQQAILIRNPDTSDGTAEFALADEFGRVQRYVEASPRIELASYVGQRVDVRSDTGETLLASQLVLPAQVGPTPGVVTAQHEEIQPVPLQKFEEGSPSVTQAEPNFVDGPVVPNSGTPCNCPQCQGSHLGHSPNDGYILPYQGCTDVVPQCGDACQDCGPSGPSCCRGSRGRFYGRAEYVLWWLDGFHVPPLVTTNPGNPPQAQAGVLGQPGTQVLFGNGEILSDSRSGMRLMLGTWLNDYRDIGIEGDVIWLGSESVGFSATGEGGAPILARPFFNMVPLDTQGNVLPPAEDAELVAFPNVVEGTVSVDARSDFSGAGLRFRAAMCCQEIGSGCNCCDPCSTRIAAPTSVSRIDFIGGYRFLRLDERVLIRENLTSLQAAPNDGTFDIFDQFDTSNEFHGGDVGFIWEWESSRWSLEFLSKVAIGSTNQRVNIAGGTTTVAGGVTTVNQGGLLALRSNIGTYQRDVFSMVPEIGLTLGYRLTPRLRATAGYTLLYWSSVARPGEHIDLDVNPNLLPPIVEPVVGPERPRFMWDDSALVAHGLNLGLDYRFCFDAAKPQAARRLRLSSVRTNSSLFYSFTSF